MHFFVYFYLLITFDFDQKTFIFSLTCTHTLRALLLGIPVIQFSSFSIRYCSTLCLRVYTQLFCLITAVILNKWFKVLKHQTGGDLVTTKETINVPEVEYLLETKAKCKNNITGNFNIYRSHFKNPADIDFVLV